MNNIMINLPLPNQLFPCLAVPFVELFPDLCLGWWLPPSLKIDQYKKMWYLRAPLQFMALFPLFDMIQPICADPSTFSLIVIGTIVSISLRNILLSKEVDRVTSTPLWSTDLPRDKRTALFVVITSIKSTDITNFDEMAARYVSFATKIALAVMYGIVHILRQHLDETENLKLMAALGAFIVGGMGIGGTRHGSVGMDRFFRCLFGVGFIAILHFVAEVSDIVLMKGIN